MKRKAALWSIVLAASAASGAVLAQTSTTDDGPAPQAAPTAPVASAPLAPAPATPPPLPPQPAAGTTPASVVSLVETVCQPLIAGGQTEKAVAKSAGLRKSQGNWVLKVKGQPNVTLTAPTEANPHACVQVIDIQPGEAKALADGLAWWAGTRAPPMKVFDNAYQSGGITSWSWTYDTATRHQGLALSVVQGGGRHGEDEATVLYSDRPQ